MSRCNYNSKRLIPCPLVTISKQFQRTPDGTLIGTFWEGNITGTIVAYKGSPDSDSILWDQSGYPDDEVVDADARLGSIFRKQEAIRELFSEDGHSLEFQSADGSQPLRCNPRITGITFSEGTWFNTCAYSISFQADIIYINGQVYGEDDVSYLNDASDVWTIDTADDYETETGRTYTLNHTVNATGKKVYDENGDLLSGLVAWQWARNWVLPRLGFQSSYLNSSGVRDLPSFYTGYNHTRNENIDELGGQYGVTETWTLASGSAIENFTISTTKSNQDGLISVGIDGTIKGLESRNGDMIVTSSKYANAVNKYSSVSGSILSRAISYSQISLNPLPLTETVSRDPFGGTINYSFQYDTRPTRLFPNAKSEVISIQDAYDAQVIAVIPIVGRAAGPILQNLNTKREKNRSINIELVVDVSSGTIVDRYNAKPDVSAVADMVKPAGSQTYQTDNGETWDISTGRYSFSRTWTYE